ncbi:MAG: hypothetical protein HY209_02985 [Candidatus Omnitrophica bacterium]|nr:hypothetical protein [Candidatus Omnitrophota bacterium]
MNKHKKGQAIVEAAIFGAILIFLMGTILRTHVSVSQNQNHQIKALKLALLQSFKGYNHKTSSRNSSSVLFVEDRLSPDVNKFAAIDRSPFIAGGSGTMSNRLFYPVDAGEIGSNLPITDIFINGQHFPLTTASLVFRRIYQPAPGVYPSVPGETCPLDTNDPEHYNCLQQQNEYLTPATCPTPPCSPYPLFFTMAVNGTVQYCYNTTQLTATCHNNVLNQLQSFHLTRQWSGPSLSFTPNKEVDSSMYPYMTWQWQAVKGTGDNVNIVKQNQDGSAPNTDNNGKINVDKTNDAYPSLDVDGDKKEETVYAVTCQSSNSLQSTIDGVDDQYKINGKILLLDNGTVLGNSGLLAKLGFDCSSSTTCIKTDGSNQSLECDPNASTFLKCKFKADSSISGCTNNAPITGVIALDTQLGDIDQTFDSSSHGPTPGLQGNMGIYTEVRPGTFLQIKEGKLYNPETHQMVRSISSKDSVDFISRTFQLSNDTRRFCPAVGTTPELTVDGESNPVQVCVDGTTTTCFDDNSRKTCFDRVNRILYIRTNVGDNRTRKWFTDVTKGL